MEKKKRGALIALLLLGSFLYGMGTTEKEEIFIASGGGYKKPVQELNAAFEEEYPIVVNPLFGNMQNLCAQIKESGRVALLVGDRKFLDDPSQRVEYSDFCPIGRGTLVLAYRKGIVLNSPEDLLESGVERIALPHKEKAIYGTAAWEYLTGRGWWDRLEEKCLVCSTVPQVSSYLISGEVDGGFINLTDATALKEELGGFMVLESGYTPIEIGAGVVKGFETDRNVQTYLDYLESPEGKEIFHSYGL
ncbi:MAG: molybdate ABC transporter substrate-binding protein [Spirochaetales bacterium]|nr:molybdate ABC transporter substrate-binding protein [Spirochaetales bacterium]